MCASREPESGKPPGCTGDCTICSLRTQKDDSVVLDTDRPVRVIADGRNLTILSTGTAARVTTPKSQGRGESGSHFVEEEQ